MKLLWGSVAWDDFLEWRRSDLAVAKKIAELIKDIMRNPFGGLGKPEPLRENLKGLWSRRITGEHRLIYRVVGSGNEQRVEIIQCRYHY